MIIPVCDLQAVFFVTDIWVQRCINDAFNFYHFCVFFQVQFHVITSAVSVALQLFLNCITQ